MRRLLTLASAIAVTVALSHALAAQNAAAAGSIFGQVVDATTGQPIPGAIVLLTDARASNAGPTPVNERAPSPSGALPPDRVITNGDGQFVFHNLPKSSYRLQAAASGYSNASYGQNRPSGPRPLLELGDNVHMSGVRMRLWKYGSLSGRVVDEVGEPAAGVTVRAYRVSIEGARRVLEAATGAYTDDRGEYRLGGLGPASYIVSIPQTITTLPLALADAIGDMRTQAAFKLTSDLGLSASPGFGRMLRGVRVGDLEVLIGDSRRPPMAPSSDPGTSLFYRTMFFPAAVNSDDATVMTLGPGDDRTGIDLRLRASPAVKVSGIATEPDGPARHLALHLIPVNARGEPDNFEAAEAATSESGGFVFLGVPSGQYILRMYRLLRSTHFGERTPNPERPLHAELPVAVGDRDVEGLAVTLREGARVGGRVVFQGADAAMAQKLQPNTNVALINLRTAEQSVPAWGTGDGTFLTDATAPGKYIITAGAPPGWELLSATREGHDLDDAPLELQTTDLDGVVVTFTNQPTHARVTVRAPEATAGADLDATVVAFPANYASWIEHGMARRRLRLASPSQAGAAVAIDGLPPGEYIVAAVQAEAWSMPHTIAFFDGLARIGTRVTLNTGQTAAVDLTVRQIR